MIYDHKMYKFSADQKEYKGSNAHKSEFQNQSHGANQSNNVLPAQADHFWNNSF
jgi:hypothetical protein